jgi:hypothetical protein
MPIVGSFAGASARAYGLGAGSVLIPAYQSIQTSTVTGSSAASITFSSIPSTFKHLEVRFSGLATSACDTAVQFNGAATNYNYHYLQTNGVSVYSGYSGAATELYCGSIVASPAVAIGVISILDYADTNKFKTVRSLSNADNNGGGYATFVSGLWRDTASISSIKFNFTGQNMLVNTTVSLYGILG